MLRARLPWAARVHGGLGAVTARSLRPRTAHLSTGRAARAAGRMPGDASPPGGPDVPAGQPPAAREAAPVPEEAPKAKKKKASVYASYDSPVDPRVEQDRAWTGEGALQA